MTTLASGGSLPSGTNYFIVVAVMKTEGDEAVSAQSAEASVVVPSNGSKVTLTWSGVAGADFYRVYRGTSAGGESRYMQSTAGMTSIVYTGSAETVATPRATGKIWNVKNLLELKNAQRVLIDGNIFEHSWAASQKGYAILLTPRNQNGNAPWAAVRDITLSNNMIRHVAGAVDILGDGLRASESAHDRHLDPQQRGVRRIEHMGQRAFLLITGAPGASRSITTRSIRSS